MQRINFTETTLTTLKRNARCSFANAVYKLTMKAQQGLKCDDLFKKSVLMNEVNKLLCKYKLDSCIVTKPELTAFGPSIYFPLGGDDTTEYSFYLNGDLISGTYTNEDIVNYFLNLGYGSIGQVPLIDPSFLEYPSGWEAGDYNVSTQNLYTTNPSLYQTIIDGEEYPIPSSFFNPLYSNEVANAIGISGSIQNEYIIIQNSNEATSEVVWAKIIVIPETCVDYTEEELNCITPQDLQLLFEFTHKYKETLAKSTKRITSPSTSSSSPSPSDCCNWGSIGGSIGNQSDLITYLANIQKNYISIDNEGTEITNDVKSINFTGSGVNATYSGSGNVTVNIPGGGGGGGFECADLEGCNISLLTNDAGYLTDISATNGLTEDPANNFKLGGTLIEDTTITQDGYLMRFEGSAAAKLDFLVTIDKVGGLGSGLYINSDRLGAVINSAGAGLSITSVGSPIAASGNFASTLTHVNNLSNSQVGILNLYKSINIASAVNSGVFISMFPGTDSGNSNIQSSDISCLIVNATQPNVQSKLVLKPQGTSTGLYGSALEAYGSGKLQLPAYGQTPANFSGTPVWSLGVDASGNVVEFVASGGTTPSTPFKSIQFNNSGAFSGSAKYTFETAPTWVSGPPANSLAIQLDSSDNSYTTQTIRSLNNGSSSLANIFMQNGTGASGVQHGVLVFNAAWGGISYLRNSGLYSTVLTDTSPPNTNAAKQLFFIAASNSNSQFEWHYNTSNNVSSLTRLMSLGANGRLNLAKYGINTFAGTPAYSLGVDASGNVVEFSGGGSSNVTSFASAADGTASSGTTNTISISVLIPANTFALDDVIRINYRIRATGVLANRETRMYANTTSSLTGAILISTVTLTNAILAGNVQRFLAIKNATTNTEVINNTSNLLTDYNIITSPSSVSTLAINWTVDQYIIFAVNVTNAADSIRATMYSIEKL